jgi:hypothetical protein
LPTTVLVVLAWIVAAIPAAAQADDPALRLAERFAPVVFLKQQVEPCDDDGEPFLPAPVDVTFNADGVVLRDAPGATPIASAVDNRALWSGGPDAFVDLPGHPREPGCIYEEVFRRQMGDRPPVVYAHVATEDGQPGLALQYWFFYWFNDFNNVHEGDWEMVQLLFAADSAAAALTGEPVAVAFAQHEGGETAEWTDPKLEREGDRPVVYPSRGSHATYFGPAVWLGWGAGGSGFGCDDTTRPSFRVDPEVRLVPSEATTGPDEPFAWVSFSGRWGERGPAFFNGPTGPAMKDHWERPITWQENLRASSLPLRSGTVVGPAATEVFCEAVADLSELLILSQPYPWLVASVILGGLGLVGLAIARARSALATAWLLYRGNLGLFAAIGAALAPITLLASGLSWALSESPDLARRLPISEDSPVLNGVATAAGLTQQAILLLFVGPAAIWATAELMAGRFPRAGSAFVAAWRALPRTAGGLVLAISATFLLAISLIGIPVALERGVRWAFVPHAAILDGVGGRTALRTSAAAVRGRWWRLAVALPLLALVGAALGPVIGIALLILGRWPLELANGVGALVYGLTQPLTLIATTVLYLRARPEPLAPAPQPDRPPSPGERTPTAPTPSPASARWLPRRSVAQAGSDR